MHVVERWTRPNKSTLHYEATVTDPGAYTRPFTMAWDIPVETTAASCRSTSARRTTST